MTLPKDWRRALGAGEVGVPDGDQQNVVLAAPNGTTFVVTTSGRTRQLQKLQRGHGPTLVQDFGAQHPDWQVLAATFDGRYLAYRVDQSLENFDDFSLYVWDSSADGAPVKVAHGEKDSDGALMATPFVDPVLADGWLYWTQTRDQDPEHTVLSGYRMKDRHREVLSRGFGRAPVRFGDDLVWTDSDHAGEKTTLRFLDLGTRKPVATPAALRKVTGVFYLAGDASSLVWVGGSKADQVWAYRAGWTSPHLLVTKAKAAQFPRMAGDVVVFGQQDAMYAADLRSWSYTKVTPQYGGITADGGPFVIVGFAPVAKAGRSTQSLLDTRTVRPLGRSGC